MSKIEPRIFKGTRDFLPAEQIHRERIIAQIKAVFDRYGFDPLETPAIEYLELLTAKYGEEGEKLIYRLAYKGGRELALRYDLTVPVARVMAMYPDLVLPFKRYQIQPVWRADAPQIRQGRYREFYQCDVDILGSDSLLADAEILAITNEILTILGFAGFRIRINNRKILAGIVLQAGLDQTRAPEVCRAIDKKDKVGLAGVRDALGALGISDNSAELILEICAVRGDQQTVLNEAERLLRKIAIAQEGIEELRKLLGHLHAMGVPEKNYTIDLYLTRALDYYTGPIFESVLPDQPHIGSLTGGGRYDHLIGMFSGSEVPATGTTIGLDRIFTAMEQLNILPPGKTNTQVLVCQFDVNLVEQCLKTAQLLRDAGISTEVYLSSDKLKKQFAYADKKKIPLVILIGPEEARTNSVTIRRMVESKQETVSREEIINWIKRKLVVSASGT